MLLYVDDIIITVSDLAYISDLKIALGLEFQLTDLGSLKYFLGLEIHYSSAGLHVTQLKYLTDFLKKAGMVDSKSCNTPMSSSCDFYAASSLFSDPLLYRKIVGSLQYLTFKRLDIQFVVSKVSQFMHNPTKIHFSAVKRILRYLNGTHDYGVLFSKWNLELTVYSDDDWAGDSFDHRSTSGFVIFLCGAPIS